jgi:hypothetical protein
MWFFASPSRAAVAAAGVQGIFWLQTLSFLGNGFLCDRFGNLTVWGGPGPKKKRKKGRSDQGN